jgi:hypothetical protein
VISLVKPSTFSWIDAPSRGRGAALLLKRCEKLFESDVMRVTRQKILAVKMTALIVGHIGGLTWWFK